MFNLESLADSPYFIVLLAIIRTAVAEYQRPELRLFKKRPKNWVNPEKFLFNPQELEYWLKVMCLDDKISIQYIRHVARHVRIEPHYDIHSLKTKPPKKGIDNAAKDVIMNETPKQRHETTHDSKPETIYA